MPNSQGFRMFCVWSKLLADAHLSLPTGQQILFSSEICRKLSSIGENCLQVNESGGILLGKIFSTHIEICNITEPFPNDIRHRIRFQRQDPKHLSSWKKLQKESDNTIGYIGEWHSHPDGQPSPSSIDNLEWNKIIKEVGSPLLFLIVGNEGVYVRHV